MELQELLKGVQSYNAHANTELLTKAYTFAQKAHEGQKRASGDAFFLHPLEVAKILISLRADSATLCAAILHDVLEDTTIPMDQIKKEFGEEIALLVSGVTKIRGIVFESKEAYKAENFRKMLLATTKDVRVMLIKLADRLHNMKTLKDFREDKQKRIAKETLRIYAPIAEKLGMWNLKGELEDLSLRYLEPQVYAELKAKISQKRTEREAVTQRIVEHIKKKLSESKIESYTTGRAKYFYSIYKKMKEENKTFDLIFDLIGIRIVVNTIPDCYRVLGIIHELWAPVDERFKDYIAHPKPNGYRSLHTTVAYDQDRLLEFQIRTKEMHWFAEEGVAAHWRYKGTERDRQFDKRLAWLKQLLLWKRTINHGSEYVENLKIDIFKNEIIVLTPKSDPIMLPEGSTPLDFAYEVHSDLGEQCSKAKVNGSIVPLDHKLQSGDIVEIITGSNVTPSRQWLKFVVTSKAKSKIKSSLHIMTDKKKTTFSEDSALLHLEVLGTKAPPKLSKCCAPHPGDPIAGYLTKDNKVTIHKVGCPNIHALTLFKKVEVGWINTVDASLVHLQITANDRIGLLADILYVISSDKFSVTSIDTKIGKYAHVDLTIRFEDKTKVAALLAKLRSVKSVIDVKLK